MKQSPALHDLAAGGGVSTTRSRALATAELRLLQLTSTLVVLSLLACRTDTAGLERRDLEPGDSAGVAGSASSPEPSAAMTDGAGAEGEPNVAGEGGSLVVLDGLVDGGRLFVCLRDAASGAALGSGSTTLEPQPGSPTPAEGLGFGSFQRFPFDWDVTAVDVEVQLFRAEPGTPEVASCESLREAALLLPPEPADAGLAEPAPAVRSAGALTLAQGSLYEGRHYVLAATGCAAPDALAAPQLCGEPDPLFGVRSELVLVEFGLELPEGAGSFGLQFLNASRALGPADLLLQLGLPEVSVPFVSGVGFGVLRPRAVATVEQPFALELRGRGANVLPYSQSWTDTLQAGSLELQPGRSYLLASIGPLPRADGSGPSAPRLVLIPAE